jgi:hypothetical protein
MVANVQGSAFDDYGDVDVLNVVEVPDPVPATARCWYA